MQSPFFSILFKTEIRDIFVNGIENASRLSYHDAVPMDAVENNIFWISVLAHKISLYKHFEVIVTLVGNYID